MSNPTGKEKVRLKDRLEALCIEMIDDGILFSEALEQFEKCFISEVLQRHDGNLIRAAAQIGIHRNTLAKRLSRHAHRRFRIRGKSPAQ